MIPGGQGLQGGAVFLGKRAGPVGIEQADHRGVPQKTGTVPQSLMIQRGQQDLSVVIQIL